MSRRNGLFQKSSPPIEPLINVTPLIDVVFVILIAFIVIAPLLEVDRVELASGQNLQTHIPIRFDEASPVRIYVQEDNTIVCNNKVVTQDELYPLLQQTKMQHPDAKAMLFHHKKAYFGTYQAVKNTLELTEFKEMDVVLLP